MVATVFPRAGNAGMRTRYWRVVFICLPLGGCTMLAPHAPPPPASQSADPYCAGIASARARDAAENGFDGDLQAKIYADTYARCVTAPDHVDPLPRS